MWLLSLRTPFGKSYNSAWFNTVPCEWSVRSNFSARRKFFRASVNVARAQFLKTESDEKCTTYYLRCLVPRPHYYARPMRFGSRGPRKFLRPSPGRSSRIRHRNALTERAREDAVQGLGNYLRTPLIRYRHWVIQECYVTENKSCLGWRAGVEKRMH